MRRPNAGFTHPQSIFNGVNFRYFSIPLSLFDSGRERYAKLRESATRGIICQIGVAFFVYDHETACYVVHPYNFYIRPASFGPLEPAFVCQASNLEFLTRHAFDFNKVIF